MKRLLIIVTFSLLTLNGYCQMGEWTWMNGAEKIGGVFVERIK